MNPLTKKKERAQARDYLRSHPGCTYEQLVKKLGITSLSKPYFFNIRGLLRKSGAIPTVTAKVQEVKSDGEKSIAKYGSVPKTNGVQVEILHSIDATGLTPELRVHWKTTVLPVLNALVPGGKVTLAFLSDPPTLEIRRAVG